MSRADTLISFTESRGVSADHLKTGWRLGNVSDAPRENRCFYPMSCLIWDYNKYQKGKEVAGWYDIEWRVCGFEFQSGTGQPMWVREKRTKKLAILSTERRFYRNAYESFGVSPAYDLGDERFRRFFPGVSMFPRFHAAKNGIFVSPTAGGLTMGAHLGELWGAEPYLGGHHYLDEENVTSVTLAGNVAYEKLPRAYAGSGSVSPKIFFAFVVNTAGGVWGPGGQTEFTTVNWPHASKVKGAVFRKTQLTLDICGLGVIPFFEFSLTPEERVEIEWLTGDDMSNLEPLPLNRIYLKATQWWEFKGADGRALYDVQNGRQLVSRLPWGVEVGV